MTKEQWKDIPAYEGYYQTSNLGRVRSVNRVVVDVNRVRRKYTGRILRLGISSGYEHLGLYKDGTKKNFKVHRLIALVWLGPCPPGQQVRHGPLGKLDNSVENLSYGTTAEDCLDKVRDGTVGRGGGTKRPVRRSDGVEFPSMMAAARAVDSDITSISRCCGGQLQTSGGFKWEWLNDGRNL